MNELRAICDAQVHAPDLPHAGRVQGIGGSVLLHEMEVAGVARCVLVPVDPPGEDPSRNNGPTIDLALAHPARFAVMGKFDLGRPETADLLATWRRPPLLGIRASFSRDPVRALFLDDRLEWFWTAAEEAEIPVMVFAPDALGKVAMVASAHRRLRLIIDHLGLRPFTVYDDLGPAITEVSELARYDNVAVKLSALPCAVSDVYPFPSLRAPVHRVVAAYGAERVLWGSDLTRLPCTYSEWVRFFTEGTDLFTERELDQIMGRAASAWLGWDVGQPPADLART